ncbi:hypothetical protein [Streptomyces sp. NPDC055134]
MSPSRTGPTARRIVDTWPDKNDVYVYFNNDVGGAAIVDAAKFARAAAELGRTASRTPPAPPARSMS